VHRGQGGWGWEAMQLEEGQGERGWIGRPRTQDTTRAMLEKHITGSRGTQGKGGKQEWGSHCQV